MHFLRVLLSALLFTSFSAHAALLSWPAGVTQVPVPKTDFTVPAEVEISDPPARLKLSGAGVRVKAVTFLKIKADVYLAESFLDRPLTGDQAERLGQVTEAKERAIELTMLRNLSAETIRDAFRETLEFNGVPVKEGRMKEALDQVTAELPEKSKVRIVGVKANGGESLTVEIPGKTFTVKGDTIVSDFWKIWFGKPADDGLAKLQAQLLGINSREL
jgi:hypothetical protein